MDGAKKPGKDLSSLEVWEEPSTFRKFGTLKGTKGTSAARGILEASQANLREEGLPKGPGEFQDWILSEQVANTEGRNFLNEYQGTIAPENRILMTKSELAVDPYYSIQDRLPLGSSRNKVAPIKNLFSSKFTRERLETNMEKLRKAVRRIMASRQIEKDSMKRIMSGYPERREFFTLSYIHPRSSLYMVLRYLRAITIIVNFVVIPILTLFEDTNSGEYSTWLIVLVVWDIIYIIRCFLDATRVAYYDQSGMLETSPKKIFRHFISYKIDIIYRAVILFPFYAFDLNLGYIRILMFIEAVDFLMICHSIVDLCTWPMKEGITKYLTQKIGFVLFILSIYIVLISHWLACVFLLLEVEGLKGTPNEIGPGAVSSRYVSVLYFLITTSCTVGYGDITMNHTSPNFVIVRYLFQLLLMLGSVMGNAIFFSLIFSSTRNADEVTSSVRNDIDGFEVYMAIIYRKMKPSPLLNRFYRVAVSFYKFYYFFNVGQVVRKNDFLDKVPMKEELIIRRSISEDSQQKYSAFFNFLHEDTTLDLVEALTPTIFLEKDSIIKRGSESDGLYFIIDGQVNITYKNSETTLRFLDVTDDFGDFCLLNKRSHYNYVCQTDVLCMFIPSETLIKILQPKKSDYVFMQRRAKLRERQLSIHKEKYLKIREQLITKLHEGVISLPELCLIRSKDLISNVLTPKDYNLLLNTSVKNKIVGITVKNDLLQNLRFEEDKQSQASLSNRDGDEMLTAKTGGGLLPQPILAPIQESRQLDSGKNPQKTDIMFLKVADSPLQTEIPKPKKKLINKIDQVSQDPMKGFGVFLGRYAEEEVVKKYPEIENRAPVGRLHQTLLGVAVTNQKSTLTRLSEQDEFFSQVKYEKQHQLETLLMGSSSLANTADQTQQQSGTSKGRLAREKILDYVLSLRNRTNSWKLASNPLHHSKHNKGNFDKVLTSKQLDKYKIISIARLNREDIDDSLDGNSTEEENNKKSDQLKLSESQRDLPNKIPEFEEVQLSDLESADQIDPKAALQWNDACEFFNTPPYGIIETKLRNSQKQLKQVRSRTLASLQLISARFRANMRRIQRHAGMHPSS